jgi:hypothetical protein
MNDRVDGALYGGTIAGKGDKPLTVTAIPLPFDPQTTERPFRCFTADGSESLQKLSPGAPGKLGTFWKPEASAVTSPAPRASEPTATQRP